MKLIKKYLPGDKVFAKVRGYPPWPARVEAVTDPNTKNAKYKVYFYGTGETATCKVEELFVYHENKEKYAKNLKRKMFHQGIQQLEQELSVDEGKSLPVTENKEAVVEEPEVESTPVVPEAPPVAPAVSLDSDLETGPLVIDEGDKKKQLKRKTLATPIGLDSTEPKKKRARSKGWQYVPESTPKLEVGNDSQGEETLGKEVVSRSGRKIKPKRFADFSSSDEFEMENIGRGRVKSKLDDSIESQATPSTGVGKKRTSIEKDDKRLLVKEGSMQRQKYKVRWLRMEHQLLQLDAQIKSNLGLDRADADKCMHSMDEMLSLPIDPLMLKKHPHVVETVKRLRRYIGNLADWKLIDDEVVVFKDKAEQIRQKAEHICNKFKAMFVIPEGQSFWQCFSDQVEQFKELTKEMSEEKIFSLMSDPASPETNATIDPTMDDSFALSDATTTDLLEQSALGTPLVSPTK